MKLTSYGKIYALGHRAIRDLLKGPVVVQEKVDGSQGSFSVINGELHIRSRGSSVPVDTPDKLFNAFSLTAARLADEGKLEEGWIYRGEVISTNRHNVLTYEWVPEGNFVLFDVDRGLQNYVSPEELKEIGEYLGLEVVPTLYEGELGSKGELDELLQRESFLGGEILEGVVIKNYSRFTIDGKVMMGKVVREAFKERHQKKSYREPKASVIERIVEEYRTEARWHKAVQHLRDEGVLAHEPKDIGPLMKEISVDFEEECADEVAETLWNHFRKEILRGVQMGFPEWYKEQLTASQFDDE
jgi:hypothetical protein